MRRAKSLFVDLVLIALATFLALFLRDNLEYSPTRLVALLPYLAMTLLSALFVLPVLGLNRTLWRYSGVAEYSRLVTACVVIVLMAVAVGFAGSRLDNVSRAVPILQALLMVSLLVGLRVAMRAHRFRHGRKTVVAPLQDGAGAESVLV